jgi:hypothetical protein
VIVGGGIHGTCIANYLLNEGGYAHKDVRIVEPRADLLTSFDRKARQCGMQTLRSTFVQHIDTEPFSLEAFAEERCRGDELVATDGYPNRPKLDLFLDHARHVVNSENLTACHRQALVRTVSDERGLLRVETDDGELYARHVVLAIGPGHRPTYPEWTQGLPDSAPVAHVWDGDFDPTAVESFEGETIVVGGGITAAQLACRLAETTDVTLLSRHELETALSEAHPYWINWRHIEKHVHKLSPGSKARHDRIQQARNDATIPPYVEGRLTDARDCGDLDVRIGEVSCAHTTDNELVVQFADGTSASNIRIVLATGLGPVADHPLVERIADALDLERGENGLPVLDDQTLAWCHTDATESNVYASGALAETTVGPLARNVVGARRAAERLLSAWPDPRTRRRVALRSAHFG